MVNFWLTREPDGLITLHVTLCQSTARLVGMVLRSHPVRWAKLIGESLFREVAHDDGYPVPTETGAYQILTLERSQLADAPPPSGQRHS